METETLKALLSTMTPLQLTQLVKELEAEWNVTATPTTPVVPPKPDEPSPIAKTEFDVVVTETGPTRVKVLRALRVQRPDLDLRSARTLLDALPATVHEALEEPQARSFKAELESAGATVDLT